MARDAIQTRLQSWPAAIIQRIHRFDQIVNVGPHGAFLVWHHCTRATLPPSGKWVALRGVKTARFRDAARLQKKGTSSTIR